MVGIPASGKSTVALSFATALGLKYISSDEERERVTGDAGDISQDKKVWENLRANLKSSIRERGVVFDATNVSKKSRRWLIDSAKSVGVNAFAIFMDTPLDVCLKRNAARDRKVPEHVIKSFFERIEHPSEDEGLTGIYTISENED